MDLSMGIAIAGIWIGVGLTKTRKGSEYNLEEYPAYDIIYDICVKHKEFLGDTINPRGENVYTNEVLYLLQQNKTQDEIEEYLWSVCRFNPANK